MTNQEIYDLIACFDRSTAQTLKLSMQDFSIELTRGAGAAAPAAAAPASAPQPASAAPAPAAPDTVITAPIVGTYYSAAAPGEAPFVAVGDRVEKGQTVCLIEAMKMMSEIQAPCDCVIEALLQENGTLVEFGAPLLRYRKV